jgi:hypothetical protein
MSYGEKNKNNEKNIDLVIFSTLDQQISKRFLENDNYGGNLSRSGCETFGIKYDFFNNKIKKYINTGFCDDVSDIISDELKIPYWEFTPAVRELVAEVDSFLKRYRRLTAAREVINYAINNGSKLSVYGTGWEALGPYPSNITLFEPVSYLSQFEIYKKTKALLNTDPNWTAGVHDRVFNGASCYCVSLTNANKFTDLFFLDKHDCVTYSDIGDISSQLDYCLKNHDKLSSYAFQTFRLNHTWKDRCAQLLNYLDLNT